LDLTEKLERDVEVALRHPRHVGGVGTQMIDRDREPLPQVVRQQHGDEEAKTRYLGDSSERNRLAIDARRAASGSAASAARRSWLAPKRSPSISRTIARAASARASMASGEPDGAVRTCGDVAGGIGGVVATGDGVRAIGAAPPPVPGAGAEATFERARSGGTTVTTAGTTSRLALRCIAAFVRGSGSSEIAPAQSLRAASRWPSIA